MLTQREMLQIVQTQLAIELNCTVEDLNGESDTTAFVESKENAGRRPFPRKERHFDIVTMGKSIVVSATPERLEIAKSLMHGKDRDAIFALPIIRGLWLHHLPNLKMIRPILPPEGFTFELLERCKVIELLNIQGFSEALIYDTNHPYQTELAVIAKKNDMVVSIAGGCKPCARLWQIGMDTLPEYRNHGLAAFTTSRLTLEILGRGDVPTYSTKPSNIASLRVAHKAGYYVAWVSDWRCNFEGYEA